MNEIPTNRNQLAGLMPVAEWLAESAGRVFPTPKSWEFFRKGHREELVREGALFLGAGRRPDYVDANLIGAVVRDILRRESLERLGNAEVAA
ncbi:hypothetical protein [Aquabacterium sp. A08]|uniref:hypothetical protein n=1 Tax=Aquabacterium sp. A08 TaxID=2718532 RepID=UPI00141FA377|nr:hypothetical protein [Aquabacterium sp. A08]NIC43312.1 hypothetical protein [Aquabacterium sp. A08]